MFFKPVAILFLMLFMIVGCNSSGGSETAQIEKILALRATALNERNVSQYISTVSANYNDKGKTFSHIKSTLEKNFQDFEQISYESDKPYITVDGNSATSVGNYRLKLKIKGKETALNGTERLKLAKEPDGWKIIGGI